MLCEFSQQYPARHPCLLSPRRAIFNYTFGESTLTYRNRSRKQLREIEQRLQEESGRQSQIEELKKLVAEERSKRHSISQEARSLEGTLAESRAQHEALTERVRLLREELSDVYQSSSWRLTALFRSLRKLLRRLTGDEKYQQNAAHPHKQHDMLPSELYYLRHWEPQLLVLERARELLSTARRKAASTYREQRTKLSQRLNMRLRTSSPFEAEIEGRVYENLEFHDVLDDAPVRLIAFYLPQFHCIPENDAWWGQGFTEWTNVIPASPQFEGHRQPLQPSYLGYYDLADGTVMSEQVHLARISGIAAFCFYFYWFGNKTLLEDPLKYFVRDKDLNIEFCLCWANENWTRKWDGLDSEVLISQEYSRENDLKLIEYLSTYFDDERYVRVASRPVLVVYNPGALPDAAKTARLWRGWCRDNGVGEIYLVSTHSFHADNPADYGFDAAAEFPPNNTAPDVVTARAPGLSPDFEGIIYDWNSIASRSENYSDVNYKLFRAVNPGWDNTARLKHRGAIFVGSTPGRYQHWLENAARDSMDRFSDRSERIVFLNAWNEWAEGACLEPEATFGFAYLNATRRALERIKQTSVQRERKLLLIGHDGAPHGAQYLLLHLLRVMVYDLRCHVEVILLRSGPMIDEYRLHANVHCLDGNEFSRSKESELVRDLRKRGFQSAMCNTTVSGGFVKALKDADFNVVTLVHEMSGIITHYELAEQSNIIARYADRVVFPSATVAESFSRYASVPEGKVTIRPQGLYKKNRYKSRSQRSYAREELRARLGLGAQQKIVLCVGYADQRKGFDIFVEAASKIAALRSHITFLWVGDGDTRFQERSISLWRDSLDPQVFMHVSHVEDTDIYYAGADVFALASREDPFPSVVLEALDSGVPVVGFEGAGGFTDLLHQGCGLTVEMGSVEHFVEAILELVDHEGKKKHLGAVGEELIKLDYSFRHYAYDLLDFLDVAPARVSVIIPNYNYGRYLDERIRSVLAQSHPIYELIILDDASVDDSIEVINGVLAGVSIDWRLILNEENSGSPWLQWFSGASRASGEYVWIAEADDLAEPAFLQSALGPLADSKVVLSYMESKQIDENSRLIADDYAYYTGDISSQKWSVNYKETGSEEIKSALAVKNTIPNVSAAVFRRESFTSTFREYLDEIISYKHAGDWVLYIRLMQRGDVAFSADNLNIHRRHGKSLTISDASSSHFEEICKVQNLVAEEFPVQPDIAELATAYREAIRRQFGLRS